MIPSVGGNLFRGSATDAILERELRGSVVWVIRPDAASLPGLSFDVRTSSPDEWSITSIGGVGSADVTLLDINHCLLRSIQFFAKGIEKAPYLREESGFVRAQSGNFGHHAGPLHFGFAQDQFCFFARVRFRFVGSGLRDNQSVFHFVFQKLHALAIRFYYGQAVSQGPNFRLQIRDFFGDTLKIGADFRRVVTSQRGREFLFLDFERRDPWLAHFGDCLLLVFL